MKQVEQVFRQIKTGRPRVRPIFARSEDRVRTYVFLCMLACHAEWHIRRRLAPILSDEDDQEAARAQRASPVEPRCSHCVRPGAKRRAAVRSSFALLSNLSTVALNEVSIGRSESFKLIKASTPGQRKAFNLLGVNPTKIFPAVGRQNSVNRVPAKENLHLCAVKFS